MDEVIVKRARHGEDSGDEAAAAPAAAAAAAPAAAAPAAAAAEAAPAPAAADPSKPTNYWDSMMKTIESMANTDRAAELHKNLKGIWEDVHDIETLPPWWFWWSPDYEKKTAWEQRQQQEQEQQQEEQPQEHGTSATSSWEDPRAR